MFNAVGGGLRPVPSDYAKFISSTLKHYCAMLEAKIAKDRPVSDADFAEQLDTDIRVKATRA